MTHWFNREKLRKMGQSFPIVRRFDIFLVCLIVGCEIHLRLTCFSNHFKMIFLLLCLLFDFKKNCYLLNLIRLSENSLNRVKLNFNAKWQTKSQLNNVINMKCYFVSGCYNNTRYWIKTFLIVNILDQQSFMWQIDNNMRMYF